MVNAKYCTSDDVVGRDSVVELDSMLFDADIA